MTWLAGTLEADASSPTHHLSVCPSTHLSLPLSRPTVPQNSLTGQFPLSRPSAAPVSVAFPVHSSPWHVDSHVHSRVQRLGEFKFEHLDSSLHTRRGGGQPPQLAHLARLGCSAQAAGALVRRLSFSAQAAGALVRRLSVASLPACAPARLSSAHSALAPPAVPSRTEVVQLASSASAASQHLRPCSLANSALASFSVTAPRGLQVSLAPAAYNTPGEKGASLDLVRLTTRLPRGSDITSRITSFGSSSETCSRSNASNVRGWRSFHALERAGRQASTTTMDLLSSFTTLNSPSSSSGTSAKSAFQEISVNTSRVNSMSTDAGKAFEALDVNQQQQLQQTEARGEAAQEPRGFQMVVAVGEDWGMGISGRMPWEAAGQRLPGDLARFKNITTTIRPQSGSGRSTTGAGAGKVKLRNAVIMGRLTFESLPPKMRPLPGRLNIVLSRQASSTPRAQQDAGGAGDLIYCSSLDAALRLLGTGPWKESIESVFVIGGAQIYREAILSPLCEAVHVTTVHAKYQADIFFPHPEELQRSFRVWCATPRQVDNGVATSFTCYVRADPQFQAQLQQPAGTETQAASSEPAVSPASDASTRGESKGGSTAGQKENSDGASGWKAGPTEGQKRAGGVQAEGAVAALLPASVRLMHEEYQYLDLVRDIMVLGASKGDRTGTGTLSLFGKQMRFDLRHSFPLLTTKRVFWRGVVEELLWFVAGSTDANLLREKGVHIWDGNGSRQFLDSLGFTDREEGDLGPVYGFQWRHFGAQYRGMREEYSGEGVDQLAEVVHKLRHKPEDRRIILSAWNPAALHLMALPPCHLLSQFYVANGELTCQLYQRSCDMGLGVPFNIASYALLTCMLAHVCGLVPGELVHTLGDAHVYKNHVEPLKQQLLNAPRPFPVLRIKREVKDIDGFHADDFELVGYKPHKKIAMDMAV